MTDDNGQRHIGTKAIAGSVYTLMLIALGEFAFSAIRTMILSKPLDVIEVSLILETLAPLVALLRLFRRQSRREILATLAIVIVFDILVFGICTAVA